MAVDADFGVIGHVGEAVGVVEGVSAGAQEDAGEETEQEAGEADDAVPAHW